MASASDRGRAVNEPVICDQDSAQTLQQLAQRTIQRDAAIEWAKREHRALLRVCITLGLMTVAAASGWAAFLLKGWRP